MNDSKIRLLYTGPFGTFTGAGRAGADYLEALRRTGEVELSIAPSVPTWNPEAIPPYCELSEFVDRTIAPTHILCHGMPSRLPELLNKIEACADDGVRRIALTTWETRPLPPEHVAAVSHFDQVIVPSGWTAGTFESQLEDYAPGVSVVPHGFDPDWWIHRAAWPPEREEEDYSFYAVGSWSERKNFMGALIAYMAEFHADERVQFCVLSPMVNQDAVEIAQRAAGVPPEELPVIKLVGAQIGWQKYRQLHRMSHCYVSTSRGEAWNLPLFEAACVGNATISPNDGGSTEYAAAIADRVSHQLLSVHETPCVPYDQVQAKPVRVGKRKTQMRVRKRVAASGTTIKQRWFEPRLDELQAWMRRAYDHRAHKRYGEWSTQVKQAQAKLIERYSLDVIGPRLLETLADA